MRAITRIRIADNVGRLRSLCAKFMASFTAVESGSEFTSDYKIYYRNETGQAISPFHDIPLFASADKRTLNMVVEVPRWTNAKMEIATKEPLNPIKQDIKRGKPRFVHNCFPHHGYIFNYGAFPQTWENPQHRDDHTNCLGDNDPLDVCEIGSVVAKRGQVKQVKILGLMALIDEGETDWKIIAVDVTDPQADKMNDIGDVDVVMPGLIAAIREWFKIYKMPAGNPPNAFAFDGAAKERGFACSIIEACHEQWKQLIAKKADGGALALANTSVEGSPFRIDPAKAGEILAAAAKLGSPASVDASVDKWHYVKA
ncbi:uncharacterized protein [Oscarella lobularis]|uniref:uncharacterized protein n=1 Tax=Oscarella lobularis TaxID=121494 RepID=UPI003313D4D7